MASSLNVQDIVGELDAVRQRWRARQARSLEPGGRDLPAREALAGIVALLKGALFPMRLGPSDLRQESENFYVGHALDVALHGLIEQARLELQYQRSHHEPEAHEVHDAREAHDAHAKRPAQPPPPENAPHAASARHMEDVQREDTPQENIRREGIQREDTRRESPQWKDAQREDTRQEATPRADNDNAPNVALQARDLIEAFAQRLPTVRALLDSDVLAAFHGDPAASSVDEVLLCYPGVLAIIHYRLAHELYRLGLPLLARIVAEIAHGATGIDIHPGARIGAGFFIDHGTGVVIGETSVIGERVRIYQAVTLGAKRFPRDANGYLEKGLPRHPVVEDDVVIYAGATVLGRITLGKGAVIGGNVWLTDDVPPGAHVTQAVSRHDTRLTDATEPGSGFVQTPASPRGSVGASIEALAEISANAAATARTGGAPATGAGAR